MKTSRLLTSLAFAAVSCFCMSCRSSASFYKVEDGVFTNGEEAHYYYIGANFWYGAIIGSESAGGAAVPD